MKTKRQIMV